MNAAGTSSIDVIHVGLVRRVSRLAAVLSLASAAAAFTTDRPLAFGIALGAGAMLGLLFIYRWLAQGLLGPAGARWYRPLFWLIWLLKWPVLGTIFYFAFRSGLASVVGMILGISVLPAAAVAVVGWALLADVWRRRRAAGGDL